MAVSNVYCIQGNVVGRQLKNWPAGRGWNEDIAFTLNLIDRHIVAYACVRHDAGDEQVERMQAEVGRSMPSVMLESALSSSGGCV